ncbi:pentapeptide repeat-containing protein [Nostoc sp. UIC 10630]|uniref:pentapeptide repeat-containing protein n=1 Tax=Nostoc sp. UIC 10630 TaxID=2100146 RepID=UPI0013D37E42|nr:pentapeptide repeat-containing protein [Nostoc sp. UIC 10630]NEU82091.1 pentapeptide repeat-containing protein [Nostoc sp. UIC 10630]
MSWKMTAVELLERYAAGERDFAGVDLNGVDLSGAVLREINLDRADLTGVNFTGADLSGGYARNHGPAYTKIRYAILRNAIFRDANVSYVNFFHSDLSFANFSRAYGEGISFEDACLFCAELNDAQIRICSFDGANVEGTILEDA